MCALDHDVVQGSPLRSALACREARDMSCAGRCARGLDDVVSERKVGSYAMALAQLLTSELDRLYPKWDIDSVRRI